jgi:hypothetical protein
MGAAGDQMALKIEVVVELGMGGEEPLRRAWRSESAPLPFPTALWLV